MIEEEAQNCSAGFENARKGVNIMTDIKIFRANRGEGKTKWLFERAVEARDAGCELWYIGANGTMFGLSEMWRAEMHEPCPIKNTNGSYGPQSKTANHCFLTDEFIPNMYMAGFWSNIVKQFDGTWYITMDTGDFVN